MTVPELALRKERGEKIVALTAYDYPMALLVDGAGADITLVGDSLGMEALGFDSTLPVTLEILLHHLKAVRRGTQRALLLADLPFLSYQVNSDEAVRNAGRLMQEGGANAVKLEGGAAFAPTVRRLTDAGIPVVGHLGFTPQSVNLIGVRVQGKDEVGAARLRSDALALQDAGAFAIVLELVPPALAAEITSSLNIPTIGIGAGPHCDGQVLVTTDLIGMRPDRPTLKHVRPYAHVGADIQTALHAFCADVKVGTFP
jgi:3-methyl-2-oxobutanoate hydroxymethyltransferase